MEITKVLANLNPELVSEIRESSNEIEIPKNTEVIHEGQYIKAVPIITKGLIKVYTRHEDRELLLYYIKTGETCIMSFDAAMKNTPSKIYATTEENSTVLLMPVDKVFRWMKQYSDLNSLFFLQYNMRYNELIHTINELIFEKMDQRIYKYLKTKPEVAGQNPLKISHRKIATDLGTAREVISRIMKKLESDGRVIQLESGIKIL